MSESNMQNTHSPYTPTTKEVELYFKQAVPEPYGQELDDAFDRWLAEVKAQVWEEGWVSCFHAYWHKEENPYRQGENK